MANGIVAICVEWALRDINSAARDVSAQHAHLFQQIDQLEKSVFAALLARQEARAA